jgi:hypothetical protein
MPNKHSFSHMNNNIDILILSLFYEVTGYMTSDEIRRLSTCMRTFLYSSIDSSYIDARCTHHACFTCIYLFYIHKRKEKKNRTVATKKNWILLMTIAIHQRLDVTKTGKKTGGCVSIHTQATHSYYLEYKEGRRQER